MIVFTWNIYTKYTTPRFYHSFWIWKDDARKIFNIRWPHKPKIISEKPGLGSGGSLIRNIKFLEKNFILIYLDIFFDINFSRFLNKYKNENKIFSHKTSHKFDSDVIIVDKDNIIKKICTKNSKKKILSNISFSGIFFFKKKYFK